MRKSRAITLTLLGFGTAGLAGCGKEARNQPPTARDDSPPEALVAPAPRAADPDAVGFEPDDAWHDKDGNPIAQEWVAGPDGKKVPAQHPHDSLGRPWVADADGNLVPPPPAVLRPRRVIGSIGFVYVGPADGRSAARVMAMPRGGFGTTGAGIGSPGG